MFMSYVQTVIHGYIESKSKICHKQILTWHNRVKVDYLDVVSFSDGYISNTCVDVDYEAVKRKVLESRKLDTSPLPPPPPDPPLMLNVESYNRDRYS